MTGTGATWSATRGGDEGPGCIGGLGCCLSAGLDDWTSCPGSVCAVQEAREVAPTIAWFLSGNILISGRVVLVIRLGNAVNIVDDEGDRATYHVDDHPR